MFRMSLPVGAGALPIKRNKKQFWLTFHGRCGQKNTYNLLNKMMSF